MKYKAAYHKVVRPEKEEVMAENQEKYEVESGIPLQQMEMFKVEAGIPIPGRGAKRYMACPYPFPKMKLGDSFLIPVTGKALRLEQIRVSDWRRRHFKLLKIETHKVKGGLRVWRTK